VKDRASPMARPAGQTDFRFGLDPALVVVALRELADDIEARQATPLSTYQKITTSADDFVTSELVVVYCEADQ
jgi:hypothetical protein